MKSQILPLGLALSVLGSLGHAQSFNIDIGANPTTAPLPTAAYGAAAAQPGTWNAKSAILATAQSLVDIAGAATSATITRSGAGAAHFAFQNVGTLGDDQALMDDIQDIGAAPAVTTWTFNNLSAGSYTLYTYAWAPDDGTFVTTVTGSGTAVGGPWPGALTAGVTHAVDTFPSVPAAGSISVTLTSTFGFGSCNGFQLKKNVTPTTPATPYCFGDGTGNPCPCANGTAGNGCANSINAAGGNLAGSGVASIGSDSFLLSGSGMPNASCLYFQGDSQIAGGLGSVFGDGLRCAGTGVKRLGTKTNVLGASQYPEGADALISIRGMVAAGNTKNYQAWYRNAAAFCNPETFNLTNAVSVTWVP